VAVLSKDWPIDTGMSKIKMLLLQFIHLHIDNLETCSVMCGLVVFGMHGHIFLFDFFQFLRLKLII